MVIFHSYVSLPEGIDGEIQWNPFNKGEVTLKYVSNGLQHLAIQDLAGISGASDNKTLVIVWVNPHVGWRIP